MLLGERTRKLLKRKPTLAVDMMLKSDDYFERELEDDEIEERNYEEVLNNFTWIKGQLYKDASKNI